MNIMAGRALAALGIVFAFLGIWITAIEVSGFGVTYWDTDGTLGWFLLLLACLAVLLLVLAFATGKPVYDFALAAVGGVMLGMYLFFPATLAGNRWGWIGTGGWLGICSILVAIGALVAYFSARRDRLAERVVLTQRARTALGVAALGLVIVVVSLFLDVERGREGGTYWNVPGGGHSLGYLFLIVIVVTLAALAAGAAGGVAAGMLVGAVAACVLFALSFYIIVGDAFNQLDNLDIGGWLGFVGGVLAAGGALLAWHETISRQQPPVVPVPAPVV